MRRPNVSPEEYRLAKARAQRQAMRAVKRTLIAFAIVAAAIYLFLVRNQPQEVRQTPQIPVVEITDEQPNASSETSNNNPDVADLKDKE